MGRNLYIGDWHYDHANCIAFDNRPFQDVDTMNGVLVRNWNDAVGPDDTVYILGDMFWKVPDTNAARILEELNGRKILIAGNHDDTRPAGADAGLDGRTAPEAARKFDAVLDYAEIDDGGRMVVLCHYPILSFRRMFHGARHLYAHVHDSFDWRIFESAKSKFEALYERPVLAYNAGAMMPWMGYAPRTLDEIESGYAAWKKLHDAAGPAPGPEIDRMLTLSTAHVSNATAEMLRDEPDGNRMGLAVYRKSGTPDGEGYGWYVYLPVHPGKNVPEDLKRCMSLASSLGCRVLCLDADGPEDPSLPVFEWNEDTEQEE